MPGAVPRQQPLARDSYLKDSVALRNPVALAASETTAWAYLRQGQQAIVATLTAGNAATKKEIMLPGGPVVGASGTTPLLACGPDGLPSLLLPASQPLWQWAARSTRLSSKSAPYGLIAGAGGQQWLVYSSGDTLNIATLSSNGSDQQDPNPGNPCLRTASSGGGR